MFKVRLLNLSACFMLIMVCMRYTTALPVEEELGEVEQDKVMTKSILAKVFYEMLKLKGDTELSQQKSTNYDSSSDYSKRSQNSRWAGTGVSQTYIGPFALRANSAQGNYKRPLMNEWKRQQRPVCLWKVCPAAPWLVDRR